MLTQLLAPPKEIDLMGEEAMANAYNISHNVQVSCSYCLKTKQVDLELGWVTMSRCSIHIV